MSLRTRDRDALEQKLGYRFEDPALLTRALTHSSAVSPTKRTEQSYQRLEFLGDRVLGLVVADMLSQKLPKAKRKYPQSRVTQSLWILLAIVVVAWLISMI